MQLERFTSFYECKSMNFYIKLIMQSYY
jgi:hypothetical protein